MMNIVLFLMVTFLLVIGLMSYKLTWHGGLILFSLSMLILLMLFPWSLNFYFFSYYLDYLTYFLLYLSIFITFLMVTSSNKIYKLKKETCLFYLMLVMLILSLVVSFLVDSGLWFYFFFEFSLIPTMFLIMGWGYQIERIQSTLYFLVYTLIASLPLLLILLKMEGVFGGLSFSMHLVLRAHLDFSSAFLSALLFWTLMGAFLVKLPMFIFHLWLPKAHVEAPVSGSMILAGVLLKLGGYGMMRLLPFAKGLFLKFSFFFMSIALSSIVFISMTCLRSNDLKSLIAYSSVAHMGLALCGLLSIFTLGLSGSFLMLVGHGVCSSGLFAYVNVIYERSSSRSLFVSKGILALSVFSAAFMFILSVVNMGAPPSMNLFSELLLVSSVLGFSGASLLLILLGSFLVASYCMVLFSSSQHGKIYSKMNLFSWIKEIEYLTLFSHIFPLILSFLFLTLMT